MILLKVMWLAGLKKWMILKQKAVTVWGETNNKNMLFPAEQHE